MTDQGDVGRVPEQDPGPDDAAESASPDEVRRDRPADGTPAGGTDHAGDLVSKSEASAGATPGDDGQATDAKPATPDEDDAVHLTRLAERETAYGLFQRGQGLLRRRHHAQAAVVLERAARLEPGKGSIVEALGRAYYNSGQHAEAARVFEELLVIDPSAAYGHFALGQALKQLGRRDEARTHLRLAVAMAPESRLYRDALSRLE